MVDPVYVAEPIVYTPALPLPTPSGPLVATDAPATIAAPTIPSASLVAQPAPIATAPAPAPALQPSVIHETLGWDALAAGQDVRAEDDFIDALTADPNNPRARVGYAFSMALLGRSPTATVAMKDALTLSPDILDTIHTSAALRNRLTDVARQLEAQGALNNSTDDLFLSATLRAAVGDRAQASYEMEVAAHRGALSPVESDFRARLAQQIASGM